MSEFMLTMTADEIAELICDEIENLHEELGSTHTVDSGTLRAAAVARLFGEVAA